MQVRLGASLDLLIYFDIFIYIYIYFKDGGCPTTFCCLELAVCSSHSMSRELEEGNWWWHGRVALSPTTFFISV